MGRIRTVKPEFWKNEDMNAQPEATRLLAIALLNYADDEGYFNANELLIKSECCPLNNPSVKIPVSLKQLAKMNYIRLGSTKDGKRYGCIVNFATHQVISHKKDSKIKELDISWEDSSNDTGTIQEDSIPEQGTGNRERKGKEQKKKEASSLSLREWFDEIMWKSIQPDNKRKYKDKTWDEIKKLNPDDQTRREIITYFDAFPKVYETYRLAGEFTPEMQDPFRVIKNRRFKEALTPCVKNAKGEFAGIVYTDWGAYQRAKQEGKENIRFEGKRPNV